MKWFNQIVSKSLLGVLLVGVSQIATADAGVGLKNFAQFYQNLLTSFAINPVPTDVRDAYLSVQSRLPQTGRIDDMNSAVPVGQLMLVHKMCQTFVKNESAKAATDRLAFGQIDFAAPLSGLTQDQLKTVLNNIGNVVLMDALSAKQHADLMARTLKLITLFTDKPQAQSLLMSEMCTMVTASLGAIVI